MKEIDVSNIKDIKKEDSVTESFYIDDFDIEDMYISEDDLNDKMINYMESLVRNSFEYKNYIQYLKNELNLKSCALLKNLNVDDVQISLEFHHHPMTLYDIVKTVANKYTSDGDSASTLDIAEEVTKEHYKGHIGLVPLSKSVHEMAHEGSILIPIDNVVGDIDKFIEEYEGYMPEDALNKIDIVKNYDKHEVDEYNSAKLKKRILKYDVHYNEKKDEDDDE